MGDSVADNSSGDKSEYSFSSEWTRGACVKNCLLFLHNASQNNLALFIFLANSWHTLVSKTFSFGLVLPFGDVLVSIRVLVGIRAIFIPF